MVTIDRITELVYGKLRDSGSNQGADIVAHSNVLTFGEAQSLYEIAKGAAHLVTERHDLPAMRVALWTMDRAYAVAAFHHPAKRLDRVGIETRYLIIPADEINTKLGGSLAWLLIDRHLKIPDELYTVVTPLPPFTITISDLFARAVEAVRQTLEVLSPGFFLDILAGIRQRDEKSVVITNVNPVNYAEIALALAMFTPLEQRQTLTFAVPSFADLLLTSPAPIAVHLSPTAETTRHRVQFRFDCAQRKGIPSPEHDPEIEQMRQMFTSGVNDDLIRSLLRYTAADMFDPDRTAEPLRLFGESAPSVESIAPLPDVLESDPTDPDREFHVPTLPTLAPDNRPKEADVIAEPQITPEPDVDASAETALPFIINQPNEPIVDQEVVDEDPAIADRSSIGFSSPGSQDKARAIDVLMRLESRKAAQKRPDEERHLCAEHLHYTWRLLTDDKNKHAQKLDILRLVRELDGDFLVLNHVLDLIAHHRNSPKSIFKPDIGKIKLTELQNLTNEDRKALDEQYEKDAHHMPEQKQAYERLKASIAARWWHFK